MADTATPAVEAAAAAPEGQSPAPAPAGIKLFAGNLSFKTTGEDLEAAFGPHGNVISANIISRGPRSLGYGFVEMATENDANAAIAAMNSAELDGRQITVEIAKPHDPTKVRDQKPKPKRKRRKKRAAGEGNAAADGAAAPAGGDGAAADGAADGEGAGKRFAGRRNRNRRNRKGKGPAAEGDAAAAGGEGGDQPAAAAPRRKAAPRKPREQVPRTPSTTTLFVANLPFTVDDAGLLEVFKDLNVVKAYVARKRNDRSKGFGFVEFANEQDQQAALAKTNDLDVEGRKLSVKVALSPAAPAAGEEGETSAPAADASAAAPAAAAGDN